LGPAAVAEHLGQRGGVPRQRLGAYAGGVVGVGPNARGDLRVAGQVLRTTGEHPFWVENRQSWLPAGELKVGDLLRTCCGSLVAVEEVEDSGQVETVYNWRIADYHTYYVSAIEGGVSIWAHNALYEVGEYDELPVEAGMHRHHVPQVVVGLEILEGYSREIGPAIKIPDWMHQEVVHVTREGFLQGQGGNIRTHIRDQLEQLKNIGVPVSALDDLRTLISWWLE